MEGIGEVASNQDNNLVKEEEWNKNNDRAKKYRPGNYVYPVFMGVD
jgi:hypothetical protein